MSNPQQDNSKREFLIRVGVTRRYGSHEIYYEISEQISVDDGQKRRDAFLNLQAQLDDQVRIFETYQLPNVKMPQFALEQANKNTNTIATFKLKKIRVENTGGKRYVKAVGGQFEKFGVNIYPECEQDKIDLDALDYGEYDFSASDFTVTIELEGSKPKRVIKIS